MTMERDGVVGQTFGQKLKRPGLLDLVSRLHGRQSRLGGEMGGMAGDARGSLVVHVGDAIERVALPRGIGMPAISCQELKVHRGSHRPPRGVGERGRPGVIGLFGLYVWWNVK